MRFYIRQLIALCNRVARVSVTNSVSQIEGSSLSESYHFVREFLFALMSATLGQLILPLAISGIMSKPLSSACLYLARLSCSVCGWKARTKKDRRATNRSNYR